MLVVFRLESITQPLFTSQHHRLVSNEHRVTDIRIGSDVKPMAVAVIQRPLRGSRVSTFYPVKTLPLLSSLDSAFQLQEYISLLIRYNVHDVERIVALPGKPGGKDKEKETEDSAEAKNDEKDSEKTKGDVTVDEACWIYEQLR